MLRTSITRAFAAAVVGMTIAAVASGAQAYTISFDTLASGALANTDPVAAAHGITFASVFKTEDLDSFGDPIPNQFHWEVYRNPDNSETYPITVLNPLSPIDYGYGAPPSPPNALNSLLDQIMMSFATPKTLTGLALKLDTSSYGDLSALNILLLDANGKEIEALPEFFPTGPSTLDYNFSPILVSAILIPSSSKLYDDITITETPVPAALPLFASGLGALGLIAYRRKRKATRAA